MKLHICISLAVVLQIVCTHATCISKTAKEFQGNCYEFFPTNMNWDQAQEHCARFNGTRSLAKVSSPSVLDFLNSLRPKNTPITGDTRVWLGATDRLREGEWLWTDGTKANLASMWRPGEPNHYKDVNEDCLDIFKWEKLNDEACSNAFPFICMEIYGTTTSSKTDPTTSVTTTGTTATSSTTNGMTATSSTANGTTATSSITNGTTATSSTTNGDVIILESEI
ncbi:rheacalcin-2-like [Physella acuta]|uniref:rheacalcin-2-like n=1 Tax=Physella acuta TaxID=109671 RepID=UPI0027DCCF80|nr:rheacalcin-2-like [Physella acuta]